MVDSRFQDSKKYLPLSNVTESEDGIYYIARSQEQDLIKYLDKKTLKTTVLCQKFNCKHDTEECQAYIDEDTYVGHMVYANGYLYRLDKPYRDSNLILYRFDAGKSTWMKLLCMLLKPTEGEILCDGVPIQDMNREFLKILGYMPQYSCLYPEFGVMEYLFYIGTLKGISKQSLQSEAETLLKKVRLWDVRE